MKGRPYDEVEIAVIEEELRAGTGWRERAAARLPHRSLGSIATFASSSGRIERVKTRRYTTREEATRAHDIRFPASPKPASDRIPVFLTDLFAEWRSR